LDVNKSVAVLGLALAFLCHPGWAAEAGKILFEQRCAACHQSAGGGSEALKAPNLTGLSQAYLQRQLEHFNKGLRGDDAKDAEGQMMRGIAAGLKDDEIEQLSEYIALLARQPAPKSEKSAGFAGRGLYSGCTSCHGAQAEGFDELGAPRLAGQHGWYLKAQLVKFRAGLRGAHADDSFGQQMRAMASAIRDDAAIDTLVNHIGSLAGE
jgi:cytochrome c oxidase subunit 2